MLQPSPPFLHGPLDVVGVLGGLTPAVRAEAALACHMSDVAADAVIAAPQTAEGAVYFVIEGTVRVSGLADHTGEVGFIDIEAGGLFGELSALAGRPALFHAVALGACRIATMPAEDFAALVAAQPPLALALLRHHAALATEMRAAPAREGNGAGRLARELLRLAEPVKGSRGALAIAKLPRHREFAAWTGLGEAEIAEALAGFVKAKYVARRYPGLAILDESRLREMSAE